ncbi:hypothetical protein GGS21DRAFT_530107 [Xylaria nigripes]|nr:hypothetical protein GGS21DRAFT_530107 [Xylaria nigripes]
MLFGVFFAFWRFLQIVTLVSAQSSHHRHQTSRLNQTTHPTQIPTIGILSYFVDGYNRINALTPNYILVLFIVSVLAGAWALFTIFLYHRSSTNATFVALIDILFVGAFIGAVYQQRFLTGADCTRVVPGSSVDISLGIFGSASLNGLDVQVDKSCALLKTTFAFGIINTILFFFTAVLACIHGDRMGAGGQKTYVRETHIHRHGNRSHGQHSRHGSHHSHRRVYV